MEVWGFRRLGLDRLLEWGSKARVSPNRSFSKSKEILSEQVGGGAVPNCSLGPSCGRFTGAAERKDVPCCSSRTSARAVLKASSSRQWPAVVVRTKYHLGRALSSPCDAKQRLFLFSWADLMRRVKRQQWHGSSLDTAPIEWLTFAYSKNGSALLFEWDPMCLATPWFSLGK